MLGIVQKARGAHIGGEHALFNQTMSVVPLNGDDALYFSVRIKNHLRFGAIKINRTTLQTRFEQYTIERVQILQMWQQWFVLYCESTIGLGQHRRHRRVRQSRMRPHHRRIKFVAGDFTMRVDGHVTYHAQPLDFRVQRTKSVRENLRQHRNHASRKIYRVTAILCLDIERITLANVMTDIGNRHHQPESPALWFGIHRIIKIARGFTVYGDQRQFAQIFTSGDILF